MSHPFRTNRIFTQAAFAPRGQLCHVALHQIMEPLNPLTTALVGIATSAMSAEMHEFPMKHIMPRISRVVKADSLVLGI